MRNFRDLEMHIDIPDIFDLDHSDKYVLSVRVHSDGCSLALYDPWQDGSYFFQEIPYNQKVSVVANFKDFFFENNFLSLPYKKLQIMSYSPTFTCVPSVMYEEKDKNKIFGFNYTRHVQKSLEQRLRSPEMHIIYDMEEEMYEFVHRSFLNPEFIHHVSPLISFFNTRSRMGNTNKLIINLQRDSIDILCFCESDLVLVNNFLCKEPDDMIYYVLYIWKHLKLNQLKDIAIVTGLHGHKDFLMNSLKQYIKNIVPYNIVPEHHFFGVDTKQVPFDQLILSLCEL